MHRRSRHVSASWACRQSKETPRDGVVTSTSSLARVSLLSSSLLPSLMFLSSDDMFCRTELSHHHPELVIAYARIFCKCKCVNAPHVCSLPKKQRSAKRKARHVPSVQTRKHEQRHPPGRKRSPHSHFQHRPPYFMTSQTQHSNTLTRQKTISRGSKRARQPPRSYSLVLHSRPRTAPAFAIDLQSSLLNPASLFYPVSPVLCPLSHLSSPPSSPSSPSQHHVLSLLPSRHTSLTSRRNRNIFLQQHEQLST